MKQTAMQDLREDLILTQTSVKDALIEIENQEIRKACQEVVRLTLSNIIKRIDEELLEMEKQQIIDAHIKGHNEPSSTIKHFDAEQYFNETFGK
jgi:hypothetical protein